MISFKGEFVIFAAKLKDDLYLLKERLLSHNGEFVSIKGWKNNGGNVVFNGRIVIEPYDNLWTHDVNYKNLFKDHSYGYLTWYHQHFFNRSPKNAKKWFFKKWDFAVSTISHSKKQL